MLWVVSEREGLQRDMAELKAGLRTFLTEAPQAGREGRVMEQIRKDDGNRNALEMFLKDEENIIELINVLWQGSQYWKARVVLEMYWEIKEKYKSRG
jgi:hypothetical protein